MEECYQWNATGQCSKRESCSFSHRSNRGQKTQSFSLVPTAQTQIDGRRPSKAVAPGEVAFLERKAKKRSQNTLKDVVRIRHVIVGILPSVKITNLHRDADSATNDSSDVLRRMGSPVKSRRKWVERIRRLTEGLFAIGLRVPRYRTSAKVNPTEKLKIRTKVHRHILQRHIT